jgi:citrate lyase subunit beta / citryl-CoA lyase
MTIATAGNKGKDVRSDCHVSLEIRQKGGRELVLESKVERLYGRQIRTQINTMLDFFDLEHVYLEFDDSGAVPLVIAARMEAAIKKIIKTDKEFLPDQLSQNNQETLRDRQRFSRLYLPGNSPKLMLNAGIHHPDGIILDLEDSVAPDRKFEAAFLVRNALRAIDFYGAERMVRINQVPAGLNDIDFVAPHGLNLILVPKVEEADQIHQVNERIEALRKVKAFTQPIWLMPIIESALGVVNAYAIASAAPNVVALAVGLEDYTADIGARRTNEAWESFYARSAVVNAARAAGIQPIDSVFSDVDDMDALANNVKTSKSLGFDGMGCIHPRQIAVIHENFAPSPAEIDKAKKIVLAFEDAGKKGLGVVSLGSKMIDPPVVKRALKTIQLAVGRGLLDPDWMLNEQ